jgi:hypothetical protein
LAEYAACSRNTSVFNRSISGRGRSVNSWNTGLSVADSIAACSARTKAAPSASGSAGRPAGLSA